MTDSLPDQRDKLPQAILTAASQSYAESMLALIGSLNCNWPGHPPVIVYDLGLEQGTLDLLAGARVMVRKVPPFCPHWRKHFTWKIWACHEAPCASYLWLDAGIWVLRPLPEAFEAITGLGVFVRSDNTRFSRHACPALIRNLKVTDTEMAEVLNISAGMHGLLKNSRGAALLDQALKHALVEENLKAVAPRQLHDQSLLSLLIHRLFAPVVFVDRNLYGGEVGPASCEGQRLWHHRQQTCRVDRDYFIRHVGEPGAAHIPEGLPPVPPPSWVKRFRIRVARWRGRCPERVRDESIYDGVRG